MKPTVMAALAAALCIGVSAQQPAPQAAHPKPLAVGDVAPNFTLSSTAGGKVTLADYKGKNVVVLAFFPAAFTGG
jgi:thioredoxin-dependent peroxiredoxin